MPVPTRALAPAILLAAVVMATPASAAREPKTRLVSCDAGNCLLVTGHRADATAAVTINGHKVPAQGVRRWRASLPVDTVRAWSAPFARTITVSVADDRSRQSASTEADLPIGLLGHAETLAMLIVSAK